MGKHGIHDGTHLAVDGCRQSQRLPGVGGGSQETQGREAVSRNGDDRSLAATALLAEHTTIQHAKRESNAVGDGAAAFGASHERRRVTDQPEHGQFGVRDQSPHMAVRQFVRDGFLIMGMTGG